jgi:hypothetical protein
MSRRRGKIVRMTAAPPPVTVLATPEGLRERLRRKALGDAA